MRAPEPREETIRSVNDDTKKNTEGNASNNSFAEFKPLFSPGNSNAKKRNAAGIIPADAKLILPANNMEG